MRGLVVGKGGSLVLVTTKVGKGSRPEGNRRFSLGSRIAVINRSPDVLADKPSKCLPPSLPACLASYCHPLTPTFSLPTESNYKLQNQIHCLDFSYWIIRLSPILFQIQSDICLALRDWKSRLNNIWGGQEGSKSSWGVPAMLIADTPHRTREREIS